MSIFNKISEAKAEETTGFEPIPEGKYVAIVSEVEVKEEVFETKIEIELTICSGKYKNRKIWINNKLNDTTSDKKLGFVKGQIQKMSGKTEGDYFENLIGSKGNVVAISAKHNPYNGKIYVNAYINGLSNEVNELDQIPF